MKLARLPALATTSLLQTIKSPQCFGHSAVCALRASQMRSETSNAFPPFRRLEFPGGRQHTITSVVETLMDGWPRSQEEQAQIFRLLPDPLMRKKARKVFETKKRAVKAARKLARKELALKAVQAQYAERGITKQSKKGLKKDVKTMMKKQLKQKKKEQKMEEQEKKEQKRKEQKKKHKTEGQSRNVKVDSQIQKAPKLKPSTSRGLGQSTPENETRPEISKNWRKSTSEDRARPGPPETSSQMNQSKAAGDAFGKLASPTRPNDSERSEPSGSNQSKRLPCSSPEASRSRFAHAAQAEDTQHQFPTISVSSKSPEQSSLDRFAPSGKIEDELDSYLEREKQSSLKQTRTKKASIRRLYRKTF